MVERDGTGERTRLSEKEATAYFHAVCDVLVPARLPLLIRKRRGGVDGALSVPESRADLVLARGPHSFPPLILPDPALAVSEGEAYSRARMAVMEEISVERERRTNLRASRVPVATDVSRAVVNRVLDNAGHWLFLGEA